MKNNCELNRAIILLILLSYNIIIIYCGETVLRVLMGLVFKQSNEQITVNNYIAAPNGIIQVRFVKAIRYIAMFINSNRNISM